MGGGGSRRSGGAGRRGKEERSPRAGRPGQRDAGLHRGRGGEGRQIEASDPDREAARQAVGKDQAAGGRARSESRGASEGGAGGRGWGQERSGGGERSGCGLARPGSRGAGHCAGSGVLGGTPQAPALGDAQDRFRWGSKGSKTRRPRALIGQLTCVQLCVLGFF